MELKTGMIFLSGGEELVQKAIKFFTRSKFSHSFVIMPGPGGVLSALETTSTIVSFSPVSNKANEKNYIEVWLPSRVDELWLAKTYYDYSGKWYGYLSYTWFLYLWFCRLFGYEPKKMWEWCNSGVTCTELTCTYLSRIYPELFAGKDLNTLAPEELKEIMKASGEFTLLGWLNGNEITK